MYIYSKILMFTLKLVVLGYLYLNLLRLSILVMRCFWQFHSSIHATKCWIKYLPNKLKFTLISKSCCYKLHGIRHLANGERGKGTGNEGVLHKK